MTSAIKVFCSKVYDAIISVHDINNNVFFSRERFWFKLNNLGLTLSLAMKFYANMAKELKLKVRKFQGLIPTFIEVRGEKLVRESFCSTSPAAPPHPPSHPPNFE